MDATLHASQDAVLELDLTYIVQELTCDSGEHRWSADRAECAIADYKAFLQHARSDHERRRRVPNKDVDKVWHLHILHTRQYAADCDQLFGCFLHHTPRDERDASGRDCDCGCDCDS